MDHDIIDAAEADTIRAAAEAEVAAGIEFAKAGTDPKISDVTRYVHAEAKA